jgi:hypothetical protein
MERIESAGDGGPDYVVRRVAGAQSTKTYRCPGCDHEVGVGVAHVVAWREDAVDDRRHWHTACWERRTRRAPKVQRSRNAPRY